MRPADKIKRLFLESNVTVGSEVDDRVVNDAFEALEKSVKVKPANVQPDIGRTIMKSRIAKLAAAAVVIVGVSIVISYIPKDHSGSVAIADVVKAMQQVKTVTWMGTHEVDIIEKEGVFQENLGSIGRCFYKAPGRHRQEMTSKRRILKTNLVVEDKWTFITDQNAGKSIRLDPEKKTASLLIIKPDDKENPLIEFFLNPTQSLPPDAKSLGSKQIGKQEAVGFRYYKKGDGTDFWSGDITDIWADAKTNRVVLIETRSEGEWGGWVTMLKDFVFDQELDDSLFSLEIPEGYNETGPPNFMSVGPSREE
jgi:outer membrane lipoprotein-sorting protein